MSSTRNSYPPVEARRSVGVGDVRQLVRGAVRLVWEASRIESIVVLLMIALQGAGVFIILVQLTHVASGLINEESGGSSQALPSDVILFILANSLVLIADVVVVNRRTILGEKAAVYAQSRVLEVACLAELDDYDDAGFHDRLQRASQSAQSRPIMLVESILELVRSTVMLIGVLVGLIWIEPVIGLFVALSIIPIWIGGARGGAQYFEFVVDMTQGDRTRAYLFKLLTSREGAKEVRAFDLGPHLSERWRVLMSHRIDSLLHTLRRRFRSSMLASLGSNAIVALVAAVLFAFLQADILTLAEATASAGALLLFTQKLKDLVQATSMFFEAGPLIYDLQEFLRLKESLLRSRPDRAIERGFSEVVLEGVSFTYKGATRPAIAGIDLKLRAGEVVALVGENGSGKTTLTKVLSGLYPADEGRVLVDGVDIAEVDPASWRQSIAVVFQDYLHYALPARDNIALGSVEREPTDDDVRNAAVAAGAGDFLASLPEGYDTILSPEFDRGQDLSLGQWQRVALARAFYRSAPLVVLDEPTASLDARAESAIFDTVRDLYTGSTVLLISHRFSTVRTADRIVVLSDGRVVEEGTHDELLQADGLYAELFAIQASNYIGIGNGNAGRTVTNEATAMG